MSYLEITLLNADQMIRNGIDMYNIGRISRANETVPELYEQTDAILKGAAEERVALEEKITNFTKTWVITHEHNSIAEQAIYKIHYRGVSIGAAKKVEKDNYGISPLERSTRYLFESALISDFEKISDLRGECKTLGDMKQYDPQIEEMLYKYTDFYFAKQNLLKLGYTDDDVYNMMFHYYNSIALYVKSYKKILEAYKKFFSGIEEKKIMQYAKDAVRDFLFTGMKTDTVVTYNGPSMKRLLYSLYSSYNLEYLAIAAQLSKILIENDPFLFTKEHIDHIKAQADLEKKRNLDFYMFNRMNPQKNGATVSQMIARIHMDDPLMVPYDLFNVYQDHTFNDKKGKMGVYDSDKFVINSDLVQFHMFPLEAANTLDNTKIEENGIAETASYVNYTLNMLEKYNPARKSKNRKMKNINNNLDFLFKDLVMYGHINYGSWRDIQRHRSVNYCYTDTNSIVEKHLGEVYKFTDVNHSVKIQNLCTISRKMIVPFLGIMDEDVLEDCLEKSEKSKLEYNNFIQELRIELTKNLLDHYTYINKFISGIMNDKIGNFKESDKLSGIDVLNAIISLDSSLSSFLQLKDFKMKTSLTTAIHVIKERITKHGNPMYRLFALNLYRYIKQNMGKIPGFNEYFDTLMKEEKEIIDNICREYIY